jgi:hypothetical protein
MSNPVVEPTQSYAHSGQNAEFLKKQPFGKS